MPAEELEDLKDFATAELAIDIPLETDCASDCSLSGLARGDVDNLIPPVLLMSNTPLKLCKLTEAETTCCVLGWKFNLVSICGEILVGFDGPGDVAELPSSVVAAICSMASSFSNKSPSAPISSSKSSLKSPSSSDLAVEETLWP